MSNDLPASPLPPIVQVGSPVLRVRAATVSADEIDTAEFRSLVRTMVDVMRAAPGVGLAAPQIGVSKQVLVLEDREEFIARLDEQGRLARERTPVPLTVIVNPTMTLVPGERVTFFEGCLSVTGYAALVPRAAAVVVSGIDATGADATPRVWRVRGWHARILQHEIDHLMGALYIDRMHPRSMCGSGETERWSGRTTREVADGLGVDLDAP